MGRLSETTIPADKYEREIQALKQQRDEWEQKYETMADKQRRTQQELDNYVAELANI